MCAAWTASPQGAETGQRGCSRQMGKNFKRSPTAEAEPAPLPSTQRQPRWHLPALRLLAGSWGLCIIAQGQTVEEPAISRLMLWMHG